MSFYKHMVSVCSSAASFLTPTSTCLWQGGQRNLNYDRVYYDLTCPTIHIVTNKGLSVMASFGRNSNLPLYRQGSIKSITYHDHYNTVSCPLPISLYIFLPAAVTLSHVSCTPSTVPHFPHVFLLYFSLSHLSITMSLISLRQFCSSVCVCVCVLAYF